MNVRVEIQTEESWRRVLAIEVSAEDVEKEYDKVARKIAKTVRTDGYRKGKAPASLIRKRFKAQVDQEFLETVVPRALDEALKETGLDPVTEPRFEDLAFGEERPLSFKADFECRPKLELQDYRGLSAVKEVPEIGEKNVEDVLEDFRKGRAALEEVDRPSIEGDVVLVDYHAVDEMGRPIPDRQVKNYAVELGAHQVVEAFESAVLGAEPGSVREADIPYPSDYHDSDLAGTTAHYRIKVQKVQEKRFPELSDELVEKHTDVKTVEELREKVLVDLKEQADRAGVDRLEQVLLENVVDANPFDPPDGLVDGLLDDFIENQLQEAKYRGGDPASVDVQALRDGNRDGAARQVRRALVLEALARQEGIEVDEAEVRERTVQMAKVRNVPRRKLIKDLGGDRFLRRISRQIRDKKVLAFLVENAEITEKIVSPESSETVGERP